MSKALWSLSFQIEITNDVAFLLPIMVAIMVAKWVGDYITHPLYHSLLELKCIPFLDSEPIVYDEQHKL
jgi:chloride channel 7